jgi:hypothetical protein
MILDRPTFDRLQAAADATSPEAIVRTVDLRSLLDTAAELDRQCQAMTKELAASKTQLCELATNP